MESTDKNLLQSTSGMHLMHPFGLGLNVYAALHAEYGIAMTYLGDLEKAEALCEKGLYYAQEIKDLYCMGLVESIYANVFIWRGDGQRVIQHAENALRHCEETQFQIMMGLSWYAAGWGHLLLGELGTAREQADNGLAADRAVGYSQFSYFYYHLMSDICLESGDWESARRYAEDGVKEAITHEQKTGKGWLSIYLGSALAKADPSHAACGEECILQGIKSATELGLRIIPAVGYLFLGELFADTGHREKTLKTLKKAQMMFKKMGMDWWPAKVHAAYAELWKREGNRAKARKSRRTAIDIFRQCGADGWVARYEEELAAL